MKELSIEEKEKAYDEAIERARVFKKHLIEINEKDYADEMDYIFPELVESEDERIRETIIKILLCFDHYEGVTGKSMIAWVKKQGEQKPVVIPKFKVGDLIKEKRDKYGDSTIKIEAIDTENYYYFDKEFPIRISEQNDWELVEQKPTEWSEEDERMFDFAIRAIGLCKQYAINHQVSGYSKLPDVPERYEELQNWLKSLRPKSQWKPSDAQMYNLSEAAHYRCAFFSTDVLIGLYDDLKKLREE